MGSAILAGRIPVRGGFVSPRRNTLSSQHTYTLKVVMSNNAC